MSTQSIRRIYVRTRAQVEAACAEGRGTELHDQFVRDLAADFASTVFLKMEDALARATPETISEVFEWLQEYPRWAGLQFVESVTSTLVAFNASPQQVEAAQSVAATAYQGRLDKLLDASSAGGGRA